MSDPLVYALLEQKYGKDGADDITALRQQLEQAQARVAELEESVTELIQHYSETWDFPILERAESARDGCGHAWLLRKQAEAVEAAYKSTVLSTKSDMPEYEKGFDDAMGQYDTQMTNYVQRLRQQADEAEKAGGNS